MKNKIRELIGIFKRLQEIKEEKIIKSKGKKEKIKKWKSLWLTSHTWFKAENDLRKEENKEKEGKKKGKEVKKINKERKRQVYAVFVGWERGDEWYEEYRPMDTSG